MDADCISKAVFTLCAWVILALLSVEGLQVLRWPASKTHLDVCP